MVAMMIVVSNKATLGEFTASRDLRIFGWFATVVMGAAAIGMFVTL